jgi:hypothetical protein
MSDHPDRISDIVPGLPRAEALAAFRASCNRGADRLWVTESWFLPREQALAELLSDPITDFEAALLREVLEKHFALDRALQLLAWRERHDERSLVEFEQREAEQERQRRIEAGRKGLMPWEDVDACRRRRIPRELREKLRRSPATCPQCGHGADGLRWIHFRSPEWTWQHLCGREGWLAVCDACRLQVEFHVTMMN